MKIYLTSHYPYLRTKEEKTLRLAMVTEKEVLSFHKKYLKDTSTNDDILSYFEKHYALIVKEA